MTLQTIAFAGSRLDRADHVRCNPDKLAELSNWRARLLLLSATPYKPFTTELFTPFFCSTTWPWMLVGTPPIW